jgi:putative heme iron utilization protein
MPEPEPKSVIRPTDGEALRLARGLMRSARHGAIAVIDPATGGPLASRVGVATDMDGTPLILVSMLAAHTRALMADPRCSLLLGDPGKGDPLAHPRITLVCRATRLERGSDDHARAERRYLNRNPKARLYVGLRDFNIFRLDPERASLNGGFGKAFELTREDLLSDAAVASALAPIEQGAVQHMNEDHADAVSLYARHFAGAGEAEWQLTGIDPDGLDIAAGDQVRRVFFPSPLAAAAEMRPMLVDMARTARAALASA